MSNNKLSAKERERLRRVAAYLENSRLRPYKNLSGGFVQSSLLGVTKHTITIELKWGVQDGDRDEVFTEILHIDRQTFEIEN